jgi:hypothetical protein
MDEGESVDVEKDRGKIESPGEEAASGSVDLVETSQNGGEPLVLVMSNSVEVEVGMTETGLSLTPHAIITADEEEGDVADAADANTEENQGQQDSTDGDGTPLGAQVLAHVQGDKGVLVVGIGTEAETIEVKGKTETEDDGDGDTNTNMKEAGLETDADSDIEVLTSYEEFEARREQVRLELEEMKALEEAQMKEFQTLKRFTPGEKIYPGVRISNFHTVAFMLRVSRILAHSFG